MELSFTHITAYFLDYVLCTVPGFNVRTRGANRKGTDHRFAVRANQF